MVANKNQARNMTYLRDKVLRLSQASMAKTLYEMTQRVDKEGNPAPYSVSTISSWEQGRRIPQDDVVECYCILCRNVGVDIKPDFVLGVDSMMQTTESANAFQKALSKNEIDMLGLSAYRGLPVFAVFEEHAYADGWGIVSYTDPTKPVLKMEKLDLDLTDKKVLVKLYPRTPDEIEVASGKAQSTLGMSQIVDSKKPVWVSMFSTDTAIKAAYDGFYKVSEDGNFLIKNGSTVLNLTGLNNTFKVFAEQVI